MDFHTSSSIKEHNISSLQLGLLLVTYIVSTADIVLPASVAQEAGRNGWVSVLISTMTGLMIMYVYILITDIYPEKSLMKINDEIFGRFLGTLLNLSFTLYFFEILRAVNGEFSQILKDTTNTSTPYIIFFIISTFISLLALSKGLETIARLNELLLPAGFIALSLIILANVKNMDFTNFLPIIEDGWYPVLKGSIVLNGWLAELVVLIQLSKYIKQRKNIKKILCSSVILIGFAFLGGSLIVAVFGTITKNLMYPAYNFVRYASFGQYIQHIDVIFVSVWITGILIKVSLLTYGFWSCVCHIFRVKKGNILLFPIFILSISISATTIKRDGSLILYLHYTYPLFSIFYGYILPIFILICALIKNKFKRKRKEKKKIKS